MPKTGEPGDARHARMVKKLEDTTEPMVEGGVGALFGTNAARNAAASKRNQQRRTALVGDAGPRNAVEDNFNRATNKDTSSLFTNPPQPTGREPGEPEPQPMGETEVSPEEQAQYDRVVRFAAKLIYENPRKTLRMMNSKDLSIRENVGRTAAHLAEVIEGSASAKGEKISPDVMLHAGSEVIEMLMDLGVQTQTFDLDPESEAYQHEMALALMEAEKIVGERMLKDKKAPLFQDEAGTVWANEIAKEVDRGEVSPEYMSTVQGIREKNDPLAAGVRQALGK